MHRSALLLVFLLASSALAKPTPARQWARANGRIIGGSQADIADYPWQLSFQIVGSHYCGASIISSSWALTAAHCVYGFERRYISLRGGTSTRGSGGFIEQATAAYAHESYNSVTVDYDVGVVQVSGSLVCDNSQAVSLPSEGYDPEGGLAVTVTGWGTTFSGGVLTKHLQKLDISIVDRATCQDLFAGLNTVTDRMVCAGEMGKTVCSGDSGGPLASGSTQVGVVSWGNRICESGPGVYANVGNLRSWIKEKSGV